MKIFIVIIASAIPAGIMGGVIAVVLNPLIGLWEFIPAALVAIWIGFITGSVLVKCKPNKNQKSAR